MKRIQKDVTAGMREILVDWLVEVAEENKLGLKMQRYSGYKPCELKECVLAIHDLQLGRTASSSKATREKYSQQKFKCVAALISPSEIPVSYFENKTIETILIVVEQIIDHLRVDGVLVRLRDTRVVCTFVENTKPVILKHISWRETTFMALASEFCYPSDSASYNDPNVISQRLPIVLHKTRKLQIPDSL
ncbi:hypothetical protein L1987_31901 [Smallanthus sonchifolius]|uniref:Uncharacterized protein n=1 Tax=Smallanthus sonchifolius TaxID=185202 RepID=A0ACB9I687_9ASTR|nr:hypothetical protein L1987_31901 [Smallanthus sonchifolius]